MRNPLLLTVAIVCASSAAAHAIGFQTQMSCASDYYAYCSQYSVGSPEVRKCMRAAGPKLSKSCINALIADGEVSAQEVARQKEKIAAAKSKPKAADVTKKADVATLKKPEPQAGKTTKLAASTPKPTAAVKAQAPRQTIAAVAPSSNPDAIAPAATPRKLALDQRTFEDLKARGARFVASSDDEVDFAPAVAQQTQPSTEQPEPALQDEPAGGETASLPQQHTEPAAPDLAQDAPAESSPAEDVAAVSEEPAARTIQYPPGRMSLGSNLSSNRQGEQPESWWDSLVRTLTGE